MTRVTFTGIVPGSTLVLEFTDTEGVFYQSTCAGHVLTVNVPDDVPLNVICRHPQCQPLLLRDQSYVGAALEFRLDQVRLTPARDSGRPVVDPNNGEPVHRTEHSCVYPDSRNLVMLRSCNVRVLHRELLDLAASVPVIAELMQEVMQATYDPGDMLVRFRVADDWTIVNDRAISVMPGAETLWYDDAMIALRDPSGPFVNVDPVPDAHGLMRTRDPDTVTVTFLHRPGSLIRVTETLNNDVVLYDSQGFPVMTDTVTTVILPRGVPLNVTCVHQTRVTLRVNHTPYWEDVTLDFTGQEPFFIVPDGAGDGPSIADMQEASGLIMPRWTREASAPVLTGKRDIRV